MEAEGERLGEGELLGDKLALGLSDGLSLLEGLTLGEGERLGEGELLGETEADGETLGLGLTLGLTDDEGEPAAAPLTLSNSIAPATVGLPAERVKEALPTILPALKGWSAQVTPFPSLRSVQVDGAVKVGVASAMHVSWTVDLVSVRTRAGKAEVVDEAFCCVAIAPIGLT